MNVGQRSIKLHEATRGKVAIRSKMPLNTTEDLSLAYTPGVGDVSLEIASSPHRVYDLTSKGNMVAVVTDGSAILGLGNLGPLAALPVMEGKAILFKELADVDAIPICLATQEPADLIIAVRNLAPSFGGINLEDISAPRCFQVEDQLQDLGIPVFHDDQHGTAIVVLAALTNCLKILGKKISHLKIVISGSGAAGIACAKILLASGAQNIILLDRAGAIHKGREDLTVAKRAIASVTNPNGESGSLARVLAKADFFLGVSAANLLKAEQIRTMAPDSIVLALSNPVPEIMPDEAKKGGAAIVGTGRSDFPNQVNNCLAFPGVFRGALDVRATCVTPQMKVAAAMALASLVPNPTSDQILPFPLDRTVGKAVGKAVAEAWLNSKKPASP